MVRRRRSRRSRGRRPAGRGSKARCGSCSSDRWTSRGRKRARALPPINLRTEMKALAIRFLHDEQGQDLVEYALIVAAVGLALITTVNQLSQGIVSLYQSITGDLSSIGTPAA